MYKLYYLNIKLKQKIQTGKNDLVGSIIVSIIESPISNSQKTFFECKKTYAIYTGKMLSGQIIQ